MSDVSLETIVSLCKRRGFIYQGSEIYGGLAGTWDYGPLGVALKRNIMNLWWKTFVDDRDDMLGVDAAILMNQKVWQASGHVDTFVDPLVECGKCGVSHRVDKIVDVDNYRQYGKVLKAIFGKEIDKEIEATNAFIENENLSKDVFEQYEDITNDLISKSREDNFDRSALRQAVLDADRYQGVYAKMYLDKFHKCPNCGDKGWGIPISFNMMFKTHAGLSDQKVVTSYAESDYIVPGSIKSWLEEDTNSITYLRPETAQGIFTNYKNVVDSFYPDVPFGIAQQGKAFRNEISPRDFVFRSREFEQMEIEYFIHPDKWQESFEKWITDIEEFLKKLGLPDDKVHKLEVPDADRAHYSKRTIDFEYDFPIGKEELLGLAYRTDFDLKNIQKASGKSMEYRPKDGAQAFVPHVIEPSFGVERAIMAVLSAAYTEDEINGEKRAYLKLPNHLAPVKVAVSPLLKNKPELVEKAREVYKMLKAEFGNVMWDDNGNIGKRYRRQDEIGTPYCVTIDFDTLDEDTITVRSRDTTEQKRIVIPELISQLHN